MSYSSRQPLASSKEDRVVDIWARINNDLSTSTTPDLTSNTDTYNLVCGSIGAGKSSLIQSFLGKEDTVKPTVALEYLFARRPRAGSTNNAKDISHIWELGGASGSAGESNVNELLAIPLRQAIEKAVAVIVVDMGKPENAITQVTAWLKAIKSVIVAEHVKLKSSDPQRAGSMQDVAEKQYPANHPDASLVDPSPVPIVIVASKHDLLKDLPTTTRRALLQALRFIAHQNGATFVTGSVKDKGGRDVWRSAARKEMFRSVVDLEEKKKKDEAADEAAEPLEKKEEAPLKWRKAKDLTDGPFKIEPGADTFEAILSNLPKGSVKSDFLSHSGVPKDAAESWIRALEQFVGPPSDAKQEEGKDELEGDENDGNDGNAYPCPGVDEARSEAGVRLQNYRKEVERQNEINKAAEWETKQQSWKKGGSKKEKEGGKSRRK